MTPYRSHPFGPDPAEPAATGLSRRRFLAGAGAAVGAAAVGGGLAGRALVAPAAPATSPAAKSTSGHGPLVVVTLYGGNDGLNTVVPYADPAYAKARPTLGYQAGQVLDLGEGLGLNAKLTGLHQLWQEGHLAIVRGVGYPNPNLSHFASMDIWQTANVEDGSGAGWLGRWLDRTGPDPLRAVSLGATVPPMLHGASRTATALTAARIDLPAVPGLMSAYSSLEAPGADRTGLAASIAGSGSDLLQARAELDRLRPSAAAPTTASAQDLAGQLTVVAQLIAAGCPAEVYEVSLASFDTHAEEKANHESLLGQLDAALTAFLHSVAATPAGRQVVVMTFSEFGRRPAENASGGTDHGTAAPLFVLGPGVRGGFYGEEPSLTALDANANLVHTVDFRSVYATVLDGVLRADPEAVLGGSYPTLPLL